MAKQVSKNMNHIHNFKFKNLIKYLLSFCLLVFCFASCKEESKDLPFVGNAEEVDGKLVYPTIGEIKHFDQDSTAITNANFKDKLLVADFFFTSCPSICPKVMKEMMKIHEEIKALENVEMLSFTIDPKRDNVEKLKLYADNLGVDQLRWRFLTGDKDETFKLANTFFVPAMEDPNAPGGFDHSGKIILVDYDGHVRAFTEGTETEGTNAFVEKVKMLATTGR